MQVGKPLVTLEGDTFAARVAASLLHNVGLSELVTTSLPQYRVLMVALAGDNVGLRALRARLENTNEHAVLFDTPRFTRALERGYEGMWAQWTSGAAARDIDVDGT